MATALTPCPEVKVQAATARWAGRIPPEVIDGNTLVHTDVTPYNFLIHGGSMTVVDWSMPCRGAAWIDTALMVVQLIRAATARSRRRSGPAGSRHGWPPHPRQLVHSPPASPR
jgi:Ser/Thr protein kinase RdoA (MazF antagonist)